MFSPFLTFFLRITVTCHYLSDGSCMVRFMIRKQEFFLPAILLLKVSLSSYVLSLHSLFCFFLVLYYSFFSGQLLSYFFLSPPLSFSFPPVLSFSFSVSPAVLCRLSISSVPS